jgi:hypothetical protein
LAVWAAEASVSILGTAAEAGMTHRYVSGAELAAVFEGDALVETCMSGLGRSGLFADNAAVCQCLLVEGSDGRLRGRALLWSTDQGCSLLDLVYPEDKAGAGF